MKSIRLVRYRSLHKIGTVPSNDTGSALHGKFALAVPTQRNENVISISAICTATLPEALILAPSIPYLAFILMTIHSSDPLCKATQAGG
ncbi:hypothetical protein M378DRAFT_170080 [Amanita muscaria Koide BX008]|uniref:Uncharacterized protein n=1 Tax=Amanita muscaria (strain Koide BX008) TaxID=946122 RepID=A0A0C2WQA1_AMAMK|nr:hypothetical protein M378DRAFT_170080 [Amanita muscaria Koide BX008]